MQASNDKDRASSNSVSQPPLSEEVGIPLGGVSL